MFPPIKIAERGAWQDNSGIQVSKRKSEGLSCSADIIGLQDCFGGNHPIGTDGAADTTISLMAESWLSAHSWGGTLNDFCSVNISAAGSGENEDFEIQVEIKKKKKKSWLSVRFWNVFFVSLQVSMLCLHLPFDTRSQMYSLRGRNRCRQIWSTADATPCLRNDTNSRRRLALMSIRAATWKKQKENVDIFNSSPLTTILSSLASDERSVCYLHTCTCTSSRHFPLCISGSFSDLAHLYSASDVFKNLLWFYLH